MKVYFTREVSATETTLSSQTWTPSLFMLEGLAVRRGEEYPCSVNILGHKRLSPLRIVRNIYRIPELWFVEGNMVVSDNLKQQIEGMPHIEFQKVTFDKLFNVPWQDGGEALAKMLHPGDTGFEGFVQSAVPIDGPPEEVVGEYHEVILATYEDRAVPREWPGGEKVIASDVAMGFFNEYVEPFELGVSSELLKQYPLFYHPDGCHVMSEDIYRVFGAHLVPLYYRMAALDF